MENMYYIGLDVHKKTISYCVKDGSGRIYAEAEIPATRLDLDMWMKTLPQPWTVAMEATIFTAWIYDHLKPHAAAVKVAHPLMLRAIAAAKKKNDRIDAHKIADCLRCDFLPECYMASTEIRERRRTLRYRNLLVRQTVQMKRGAEDGGVPGRCGSPAKRLSGSRKQKPHRCVAGAKHRRILQRAACQVSSVADWATERKLPRPPSNCFETGRRSPTQSSVQALRG